MEKNKQTDGTVFDPADTADVQAGAALTPEQIKERADRIFEIMPSREMAEIMVRELDEKRARSIKLLYVEDQTILADYFVIATGNSNTQLRSLSGYVEEKLKKSGVEPLHVEGYNEASWILMDYAGVIVHLFTPETRQFYNLEKLWSASQEIDISGMISQD